jgi:transcription elongation factor GreB
MNRAFVRESDHPEPPDLPPLASPLPPGTMNYMTPEGAERMRAELARLTEEECPPLMAAPAGDAEAKSRLRFLEQRIDYLRQSLRIAEVVPAVGGDLDTVRFGSTVTVLDGDGLECQYRIVGVDETDLDPACVSWISPIGKALLNAPVGRQVTVRTLGGPKILEILAVRG